MMHKVLPTIICLCGDIKYWKEFVFNRRRLTIEGKIVVGPEIDDLICYKGLENQFKVLQDLQLRKMDLADEIFVVNVNGDIGLSLLTEIAYAESRDKLVTYLMPVKEILLNE